MHKIKSKGIGKKKVELFRCPECNVKNSTYRRYRFDYVCRSCGCVWEDKPIQLFRCPDCDDLNAIHRLSQDDYVCRSCGCIWEVLQEVPDGL